MDDVAAARFEHAGRQIDAVIEFLRCGDHFGAGRFFDAWLAAQRVRRGHGGDARFRGHVA